MPIHSHSKPSLPKHIPLGICVSIISFVLLLILAHLVLANQFYFLDEQLSRTIYAFRNPVLTQIMLSLTFMGGTTFLLLGGIAIGLYLFLKRSLYETILYLLILPIGFLLNLILKVVIGRERPEIDPLIHEIMSSFPSGHSMNSLLFYSLITVFVYWGTRSRFYMTIAALISIILISLIGLSRVYLGVHYPSDVLGGWIAGLWWLTTVLVINQWILRRFNRS